MGHRLGISPRRLPSATGSVNKRGSRPRLPSRTRWRRGVRRSRTERGPMREIRPLRGRVQILCDAPPKRIGSIIVPDTVQDNELDRKIVRTGVVIAMGPPPLDKRGREKPYGFGIGDRVAYQFGQLNTDGTDA